MQRQIVESRAQAVAQQNERVRDVMRHLDLDAIPIPDFGAGKEGRTVRRQAVSENDARSLLSHLPVGSLLAQCDNAKLDDLEFLYVASSTS